MNELTDIQVTGDPGSFVAWVLLAIAVAAGVWYWRKRQK